MISQEEARTRVGRGAAHLDVVRPGWFNKVDIGTLELQSGCQCVLGQLNHGHFDAAAVGLKHDIDVSDERAVAHDLVVHGFALNIHAGEVPSYASAGERQRCYMPLQDAWIEAICDRRLSTTVEDRAGEVSRGREVPNRTLAVHAR